MADRKSFDEATLTRFRVMQAADALGLLSIMLENDLTFIPVKDPHTRRWNASTARGEFEILATGVKWYDTRAQRGGGGAIDLAMHLLELSFVDAVNYLVAREGAHGSDPS